MKVNVEKLKELLNLRPTGSKGWFLSPTCVFCGSKNKMGVIFGQNMVSYKCFAGKCQKKGPISDVLKVLGRMDIIDKYRSVDIHKPMDGVLLKSNLEKIHPLPTIPPPVGFRRQYSNEYFESRGITLPQFKKYKLGVAEGNPLFKNYVIIIIEEGGECKGFIGRHIWDKAKIDRVNNKRKERGEGHLVLRYNNSKGTDFESLLLGIDEITEDTRTLIWVEGAFDKFNVERELGIVDDNDTVVLCSFGKAIKEHQIQKVIAKNPNIETNYLMFDGDAIRAAKEEGFELESYMETVYICSIPEDKDPGEMVEEDLIKSLEESLSPTQFSLRKLPKNLKI